MAGKRFKTSMSGYDKKEVDSYLKNVFEDFEMKLVEKDEQINKLIGQLKDLGTKYEGIKVKEDQIDVEKEKISKALVRADETYAQIIEDARVDAKKEKEQLEDKAEKQREKIVDISKQLLSLKETASSMIERYKNAIDEINNEYDIKAVEKEEIEEVIEIKDDVNEETATEAESFEYVEFQIKDDTELEDEDGE